MNNIVENYTVYKHTTPNNKVYIGITKRNPKDRWRNGFGYVENTYFFKAIKKYGWDNITHDILFTNLSKVDAENKEIELISLYKSTNKNFGYNIQNGGNVCGTHSKQTKLKISKALKGKQNCLGRKISQEHIRKMAEGRIGKPHPQKGKHLPEKTRLEISVKLKNLKRSEETKNKLSQIAKERLKDKTKNPMYNKKHSNEAKEKMRQKALGRKLPKETINKIIQKQQKRVMSISKDNKIKVYDSIKLAAQELNVCAQNITFCCKHPNRTCGGFYWRYDKNR